MTSTTTPAMPPSAPSARAIMEARPSCARCRRPTAYCWCPFVPTLDTRTDVLFIQHPRERDVAIGTARMAHLALPRSQLVVGIDVDTHPLVRALADAADAADSPDISCAAGAGGDVAVLFPGPTARPLEEWLAAPPRTLVVLDGTWSQAKKLLTRNPRLVALPRLSYRPPAPGNYRIRKEPSDEHLATIEAVAAVLGALEGDPAKFSALLEPFTRMVDRQLAAAATSTTGPRRVTRRRSGGGALIEMLPLVGHSERAVVVYAEANAHNRSARMPGAPELIHLVATRFTHPARQRFHAIVRPRRPLAPEVPARLDVDLERFTHGEHIQDALARFRAFLADIAADDGGNVFCLWGPYARDLLAQEGEPARGFVDMRALAARALATSPGGILGGAAALGVDVDAPAFPGRAGRMLAHLEAIFTALLARAALPPT